MFSSIWQIIRVGYSRRRSGIDSGNIEHLRADLRFRLAIMEYAYYGRSGRRVARCLEELKNLLGDKAMHRYLRSLDPDLRTQFVERFQGVRRQDEAGAASRSAKPAPGPSGSPVPGATGAELQRAFAPNVVPIRAASRKTGAVERAAANPSSASQTSRSVDSGD